MTIKQERFSEELERQICDFCRQVANSSPITSICVCGGSAQFLSDESRALLEVLLVVDGFKPRLMNYVKFFNARPAIVYTVDKWIFEKDVSFGFLGEAFAVHLIFPYIPLVNAEYLRAEEVKLKKRLILELLENLVLAFPELSREIRIKPEYFMYEAMLGRARLFPPIYYTLSRLFQKELRKQNVNQVMDGYLSALRELEKEGIVERVNGFYKVSQNFVENFRSRKALFINLLRSAQKALFMSFLGTFPRVLGVLSESVDLIMKFQFFEGGRNYWKTELDIEDPKAYLFVPTANGLAPLAAKMGIEDFARRTLKVERDTPVAVEALGGVLNDVYLVKVSLDGGERRVVVKSFKDWSGFKWFPLTLWTVGTRTFTLLGRSRLERECFINHFLYSKGFAVPRLLGINHGEKLVFMEYVEGETLEKIIKRILSREGADEIKEELKLIRRVGEVFAKVHALDVVLGDTKPENILAGRDGKIYLMDFEQASRKGDKAWDIAEFLYFIGHYASPFAGTKLVETVVKAFIEGYLGAGGSLEAVRAAGKPRYTKVFSVFVFPHVILAISNICRKAGCENG
ncbi:MAG: lipopolysaccharide kinase InaA family protein [Candidatus Bathyarchaeia archaeon]